MSVWVCVCFAICKCQAAETPQERCSVRFKSLWRHFVLRPLYRGKRALYPVLSCLILTVRVAELAPPQLSVLP